MGDDSFLDKYLELYGTRVHHISTEVDGIDEAVAYLRDEKGIEPYRWIESDEEWRQPFIHPKDNGSVMYHPFRMGAGKRPVDLSQ